ncbi:MAG TPA: undecaprenyl-diphosphatase [Frateuria sp.]|jgi:undecaprenyl-diphosphatase|uniref:undecaprenyl-diphosphatase n=1 Tax=Frateuria sp. TaxID=2211372 RepID=UPI002D7E5C98|nr:undecaprenyl-diphosphatase [Frateuria sp.]HET6805489.1 undecaprenyl-diphosphatase [Frateuria sp.]
MTPHLIQALAAEMYRWDLRWFHAIHPTMAPSTTMRLWARGLADGPLLMTAGLLGWMLVTPRRSLRWLACRVMAVAGVALVVNALVALVWDRPRPFVAGIGHAWMSHAATGSFPSDHLTLQWTIAGLLLWDGRTRWWGVVVALLGLPMAWARIYLGVHYPGDMVGALAMAVLVVASCGVVRNRLPAPAEQLRAQVD